MPLPFLAELVASHPGPQLIPSLTYTPFDELIVVDLKTGQYETRYHLDGKFFAPVNGGDFRALVDYVSANLIHPDDLEAYHTFLNPVDLSARLAAGNPSGILTGDFRYLAMNGEWRLMESLLISGPPFGLPDSVFYYYLFDVQEIRSRETGQVSGPSLPAQHLLSQMPDQSSESVFFSRVQERLSRSAEGRWCLIAVDIKHYKLFKELNGQEKGEQLLIRFAEILHDAARETGGLSCYRGQDDYALFFPFDNFRIDRLFSELCRAIDSLSGVSGFFPIFGISAIDGENANTALDVFNQAALTAEEIKDDLQYHIRIYDPKVHERHVEEFRLLAEFNKALKNGEITFYLQPVCRVPSGKIVSAETLARWHRADGSFISPATFVPVLEKYGSVGDLDLHVWESVCAWLRHVIDSGIRPVPISVNVSRSDLFSMDVAEKLAGLLEKYSLPVDLLRVEITESAYVDDSGQIRDCLSSLRAKGFRVLMDDFGSGYSSLNMLRSTNMDVIKLDAQFLHFRPGEERKGINILESVINMTKSLSTPIIVEGVDTQELVEYLSDMGCRYMQGFYFYRPMQGSQFEKLLSDPARIDLGGIRQPIHEQLHVREFLDASIYSDGMLNNILGPVVFYRLKGENVDITRFNQQFFRMVGLEADELEKRRYHIQDFFHPEDRSRFFDLLQKARLSRMSGESGFFRIFKPGGAIFWIQLHVYFLREEEDGFLFYGSARDMTELLYINTDLPGAYCRCSVDRDWEFLYVSQGFLSRLGYTESDLRLRFSGRLMNMIHPDDRETVIRETREFLRGERENLSPYRILRRDGEYRYMVDQSRYTDRFGEPCFQTVLIDITEVMTLRNQMRILEKYSTECIVFLRNITDPSTAEVVVYGLQDTLCMDQQAFSGLLRERRLVLTGAEGDSLTDRLPLYRNDPARLNGLYTLCLPDGKRVRMHVRFSPVQDASDGLSCILSMTPATV